MEEDIYKRQLDFEQDFSKRHKMVDCWISALIGGIAGIAGTMGGGLEIEGRQFSPDEQDIINRMEELSQGNPEIGQMYADFTKKAITGEGFSPGLEKDIADQEVKLSERIQSVKGLTSPSSTTQQAITGLRETGDIVKDTARRNFMQLGEQLIASRANRMMTAGSAALEPLARQREELFQSQLQTGAAKASRKAGQAGLIGQTVGGMIKK